MRYLPLWIICLFAAWVNAQPVPHVDGNVTLSVKNGQLSGTFRISNLPRLGKHYGIQLNRGLNLRFFKDNAQQVLDYGHDYVKLDYEALEYWLANRDDTLSLPASLQLSYVGAFPVYADTLSSFDDSGVMAFNGKTFRATDQTRWYPVIKDTKSGKLYDEVTYRIRVSCPDCRAIYINGSAAQTGTVATFTSEKPIRMLLFAGDYDVQTYNNVTFLNAGLSSKQATVFNNVVRSIKQFYAEKVRIPYDQQITFLKHEPIERFNEGRSWGFVNFPTIAVAGVGFREQVSDTAIQNPGSFYFYAHELAHYYFGTVLRPNTALTPFFMESTTEYLALKAGENRYGKNFIREYLSSKGSVLDGKTIIPLDQVTASEQIIRDYYRYTYGALLILSLESVVGEAKVYRLFNRILSKNGQRTDYAFLKACAAEADISRAEWQTFENLFVNVRDGSTFVQTLKRNYE